MHCSFAPHSPEKPVYGARCVSHPHGKMVLELALICWLFASVFAAEAFSQDGENAAIDAGFYDLQRAHSDRTIVIFGGELTFRKYYIVRILNQYFTVQTSMPGGEEYRLKSDGKTKTIIIY